MTDEDSSRSGVPGAVIAFVAETGSTNDDLLRTDAPEGHWLRAGRQTAGRGRLGRAWDSPPGNLHASTLVRLRRGDPPPATLALLAAVALDEVASAYAGAERLRIKWPNDLMIAAPGGWAKLAGILLERNADAVVIGIGVNLAHAPLGGERPAASLATAAGAAPEPGAFCVELAEAVSRWLGVWRGQGLAPVRTRWLARAHALGTPLVVRTGDGAAAEGLFAGLDATGALLLQTAERVRTIAAGDVFLL